MPGSELQIEAGREEHKYYPYTGIFYANRHSFWSAGQDSFTLPPTQNPDMFIQLTNVEPVLQGILQRRRGYTLFAQQGLITTATQVPTAATSAGTGVAWANPNNALIVDGAVSTLALTSGSSSQNLQITGFGFTLPAAATVSNVAVNITCSQSRLPTQFQSLASLSAFLIFNGSLVSNSALFQPTSQTLTTQTVNFNGPVAAQVNSSTFGVNISGFLPSGASSDTFSVDGVTIAITYSLQVPFSLGYSFRSENKGLRSVVFSSPSNVQAFSENGSNVLSSIFTPSAGARTPRMVLSRDFGYFADGVGADSKKWDGTALTGSLTNWGIGLNSGFTGSNFAGTAADQGGTGGPGNQGPNNAGAGSSATWLFASNVAVSGSSAEFNGLGGIPPENTGPLNVTNFGFNVPSGATITGISLTFSRSASNPLSWQDFNVQLLKGGVSTGNNLASSAFWPTSQTPTTYGGSTNLWGSTWLPSDINNNAGFGFTVNAVTQGGGNIAAFVYGIPTITVYYNQPFVWTSPANITGACDSLVATATATATATSDLRASNYGFTTIPAAQVITGIQVAITASTSSAAVPILLSPILVKAGAAVGLRKTLNVTSTALSALVFGGPADLWGGTWLPSDINGTTTFGVQFNASTVSNQATISVDCVQITVFTQAGPLTLGATGTGNITLLNGRTYFYAFQNSKTGHTGGLSAPSLSTGPLTNANQILNSIPTSTDPQVDTVLLLATADGNDQTTLFQLATVSNGTSTFTDNIPDAVSAAVTTGAVLLSNPLYLNTDQAGVIHGIANNKVPPLLNFPIKHKGRIYGAVGRTLVFSKNLDEVTTANGLITSKWEEAWPATNAFDISEQAETIQGLLSDGETLWIATERSIRRLIGDSPFNFQKPEVQFNEVGLLNQETWKVVFMEGQPVGTMWLTPDLRVIGSDFNTYLDVGTPIQDVLSGINPAALQTCHAAYVNKGPADYYMLYIPTGSNIFPDTCCVFNLRTRKWFIWQPSDQTTASLFLVDGSGQPRWLIATAASPIYEWTSGTFQDRIGNGPISYQVTIQTSWLDLGDYVLRKFLNQIIPTTADQNTLTIAVDAASNELDFNNPLQVIPATTVIPAAIPTDVFVPLASGPSHSRAFRFTFVSPPSTIANVLTGFSIEAGGFHKY